MQLTGMCTRFTSGQRTVGEEEEDRTNHGRTRCRTSCEAETWENLTEDKDTFDVWEWIDGS